MCGVISVKQRRHRSGSDRLLRQSFIKRSSNYIIDRHTPDDNAVSSAIYDVWMLNILTCKVLNTYDRGSASPVGLVAVGSRFAAATVEG